MRKIFIPIASLTMLVACGGGSGSESNNTTPTPTYTISVNSDSGVSLYHPSYQVDAGQSIELDVILEDNYELATIAGCDGEVSDGKYVIKEVNSNCTITAESIIIDAQGPQANVTFPKSSIF